MTEPGEPERLERPGLEVSESEGSRPGKTTGKGAGPDEGGTARPIDARYYDRTDYFEERAPHLTDTASPFQRYRIRKVLEIHRPGPSDRVLDLGCGWGTFTFALAPHAREVVGVDFSEKSVALCRGRLAETDLENVRFVRADAGDTGLDADSFDVVVAADLFEHLYPEDSVRVVEEAYRLLKEGGYFVIWTPHRGHLIEILKNRRILLRPDPTHVDYKSMERLTGMLQEAGFEIENSYWAESHLPILDLVERALLRWVPFLRRRIAVLARKA